MAKLHELLAVESNLSETILHYALMASVFAGLVPTLGNSQNIMHATYQSCQKLIVEKVILERWKIREVRRI